jgi:tRNA(fMet)-specific endonuclease VapC
MRYLLDTDLCIYIARRKPATIGARLNRLRSGEARISIITLLELVYGACKSQNHAENLARVQQFERIVPALPLDTQVAESYGKLRADLEGKGLMIGAYDLLIAAHALSLSLTLVTNNVREFSRVEGLQIENWAE